MQFDMTQPIRLLDGSPAMQKRGDVMEPVTLRSVIQEALLITLAGDDKLAGAAKAKHFQLALRVQASDTVDLSVEDRAMLKDRIGRAFPPLTVGRAYEMLDPQIAAVAAE